MKFKAPSSRTAPIPDTTNREGFEAFARTDEAALVSAATNSRLSKNTFYESKDESLAKLEKLATQVAKTNPLFVAQLAWWVRNNDGHRTTSHVLAGIVAATHNGAPWASKFFNKIVYRPDDMCQIMAYIWTRYPSKKGKSTSNKRKKNWVPNAVKRGFRKAFARFKPETLRRYSQNQSPSLYTLANLVHPPGAPGSAPYLLRGGNLPKVRNRESVLADNSMEASEKWDEILRDPSKVGYLMAIRNLAKVTRDAPDKLPVLLEIVSSKERLKATPVGLHELVVASVQPDVAKNRRAYSAVMTAIDNYVELVPSVPGLVILFDCSDSMDGLPKTFGSIFAAALMMKNADASLVAFGSSTEVPRVAWDKQTVSAAADKLASVSLGGTNFSLALSYVERTITEPNAISNIIILSDQEANRGTRSSTIIRALRARNPNMRVYCWDLAAQQASQVPSEEETLISGVSSEMFKILEKGQSDPNALIHEIEKITFD